MTTDPAAATAAATRAPLLLADWSDPGETVIEGLGLAAFGFYLGGDTPHVWTRTQIGRQKLRWAAPIWVPTGRGAPAGWADGQDAAAAARARGVPHGAAIAIRLDMETEEDPEFCRTFRAAVDAAGYWYGPYGSASTVFRNPHGGAGWWVADWTGRVHEYPHDDVWATQYADPALDHLPWDLSEMRDLDHLWDRARLSWKAQAAAAAHTIAGDAGALAHLIASH